MTPAARYAAAIEILDRILPGDPAERVLTNWARANRFAGSKDRAAIRDHVFDALRRKRSYAARGGAETGRGLILGALRSADIDPATVFSGVGHAPAPLEADDLAVPDTAPQSGPEALDCPDWLWPMAEADLGAAAEDIFRELRNAAPVGLRVNLARTTRDELIAQLAEAGFVAQADPRSPSAVVLEGRPRGLANLSAWMDGLFEMQDAGSQWLSDHVPLDPGQTMLDFCAGGGGKTLAVAGRVEAKFIAYDAAFKRMSDLPFRADRAGVHVSLARKFNELSPCDVVLADAPCSGSGTWRRTPDAKWRFDQAELDRLTGIQATILRQCGDLVRPGGHLVYGTCSLFHAENTVQINKFLADLPEFVCVKTDHLHPDTGSDGYFVAVLRRN